MPSVLAAHRCVGSCMHSRNCCRLCAVLGLQVATLTASSVHIFSTMTTTRLLMDPGPEQLFQSKLNINWALLERGKLDVAKSSSRLRVRTRGKCMCTGHAVHVTCDAPRYCSERMKVVIKFCMVACEAQEHTIGCNAISRRTSNSG